MSVEHKILIIDDFDSVRRDLRRIINPPESLLDNVAMLIQNKAMSTRKRHFVDEASQGLEGVEKARLAKDAGEPFTVFIVDMTMPPGIGGVETIRQIREFDKDATVIVCTGNGYVTAEEVAEANGGIAPAIIYKPDISGISKMIEGLPAKVAS